MPRAYLKIKKCTKYVIYYINLMQEQISLNRGQVLTDPEYNSHRLIDYIYHHGEEPTIPSRKGPHLSVTAIGGFIRKDIWWNIFSLY